MRLLASLILRIIEIILLPLTMLSALLSRAITRVGVHRLPLTEKVFMSAGVLPVADHYYQPLINPAKHLAVPLDRDRFLPGIDLNAAGQLELLDKFHYNEELLSMPLEKTDDPLKFYYNNRSFSSGDAEYLYNIIRHFKPSRIIEIGSGYSTLMAIHATEKNKYENPDYKVEHICIEPYEQPWLEKTSAKIIRKRVELIDHSLFATLRENDILFIDSSHIIRPQGDVLFEFLELLPLLKSGVIVHVHDIFTPRDYPKPWVIKEHRLWNEQYLLESFLTLNPSFRIIAALNYLTHNHRAAIESKCPVLEMQKGREPGSIWLRKL